MNWLFIAIIAHFLFALGFIIDKFLLSKTVLKPVAYAFYVGLLEIFVLLLIPFGFVVPSVEFNLADMKKGIEVVYTYWDKLTRKFEYPAKLKFNIVE